MPRTAPAAINTIAEEIAHIITHGAGAALAVAGLIAMLAVMPEEAEKHVWLSGLVFCLSAVALYTASTVYHSIPGKRWPLGKHVSRAVDQGAIYLLIAGSYTPFAAITLQGGLGTTLLIAIWAMALVGIFWKIFSAGRFEKLSIALYMSMGWIGVLAIKPLYDNLSGGGLSLLLGGGLAYSLGVVFYAWTRLPFNHAIWHIFVLAGTVFHYFAILLFVIPEGIS